MERLLTAIMRSPFYQVLNWLDLDGNSFGSPNAQALLAQILAEAPKLQIVSIQY